ncbi:MAG: hypothetical protein ACYTAN_11935, partial [Planctomycetota bacterium]
MLKGLAVCCLALLVWAGTSRADEGTGSEGRLEGLVIRDSRPRIWLDEAGIARLKKKVEGKTLEEIRDLAGPSAVGKALVYVITGDEASGREAIEAALEIDAGRDREALIAVCYDWCHPVLTAEERTTLGERLVEASRQRMAFGRNWRSFHNGLYTSAWPVTATAIALHGDDPFAEEALAFLKPELEDALKVFDRLFYDGEWPESVDYSRHSSMPGMRIFTALETATGADILGASPHFRNLGLFILYGTKPNGLLLPINDNDWPFLGWWEREMLLMVAARYGDPYAQYFLKH